MLVRLLVRLVVFAAAIAATAWLVPDISVEGGFVTYLWIAVIFALVNLVLGPILRLLALPLRVVTLGLISLVVNAALLAVTAGISDDLSVDGFFAAVLGALLIAVIGTVLDALVPLPT